MVLKIYLVAPLFCEAEIDHNEKLVNDLKARDYDTILPQELDKDVKMYRILKQHTKSI